MRHDDMGRQASGADDEQDLGVAAGQTIRSQGRIRRRLAEGERRAVAGEERPAGGGAEQGDEPLDGRLGGGQAQIARKDSHQLDGYDILRRPGEERDELVRPVGGLAHHHRLRPGHDSGPVGRAQGRDQSRIVEQPVNLRGI